MTRKSAREIAVMLIFKMTANPDEDALEEFFDSEYYKTLSGEADVFEEYPDEKQLDYIRRLTEGAMHYKAELDAYIGKYSKNWRPERISKTAAAVLRAAMYEVLYMEDVPDAAAINEAIEISKNYDDQEIVKFINGILGGFHAGEAAGTAGSQVSGYASETQTSEDTAETQTSEDTEETQASEDIANLQRPEEPDGQ